MNRPDGARAPAGRLLAGLLLLAALVGTINGLSRVAMPQFAAALGAPAWQVGLVGGLGYAGMLMLALPLGTWIDRHGSRRLFGIGVLVAAALYGMLTQVRQPWQAVVVAALLGMALPFRVIPSHTEFLALLPRLSASRAGWNRGANTVGMFFAGPTLAAALIAGPGWNVTWAAVALGLLLAWAVGRQVLQGPPAADEGPADLAWHARLHAQWRLVAGDVELRRTMAFDLLAQMVVAYFVVFVILLATRRFGMPLAAAAALVTLQGGGFVAVLLGGGGVVMRLAETRRYQLAFGALALQGWLCALGNGTWALWTGAALLGLGLGLQGLSSTTRYAECMQRHGRGRIGGLASIGPPAGGVLGAVGGGVVSQRWGVEVGFGLLGLACTLLVAWLLLRPQAAARDGDNG